MLKNSESSKNVLLTCLSVLLLVSCGKDQVKDKPSDESETPIT